MVHKPANRRPREGGDPGRVAEIWVHAQPNFQAASAFKHPKAKPPPRIISAGFCLLLLFSLTITYFHTGCSTIIGAKSFHGPVRDGKGWYRLAMVIRHNLYEFCRQSGNSTLNLEEVVFLFLGSHLFQQTAHTVILFITVKVIGTSRTGN